MPSSFNELTSFSICFRAEDASHSQRKCKCKKESDSSQQSKQSICNNRALPYTNHCVNRILYCANYSLQRDLVMFTSLSGHFSFRLSVFVTLVTLLVEDYLLWSKCKTRMHSSRMCTARSLTVWLGVSPSRGEGGCIPACTEADPPCGQNHRHE